MAFPAGGYSNLAAAVADSLAWLYDFNEESGSDIDCQSGYLTVPARLDLVVGDDAGDATIVPGKFGNARDLSGTTAEIYQLLNSNNTDSTSDYTISFWTNVDKANLSTTIPGYILFNDSDYSASGVGDIEIWFEPGATVDDCRLQFGVQRTNNEYYVLDIAPPFDGTWKHVCYTVHLDTGGNDTVTLRINGVAQTLTAVVTNPDWWYAYYWYYEGIKYVGCSSSTGQNRLQGGIDDLACWHRLLTTVEQDLIYNNGTGTSVLAGPLAETVSETFIMNDFSTWRSFESANFENIIFTDVVLGYITTVVSDSLELQDALYDKFIIVVKERLGLYEVPTPGVIQSILLEDAIRLRDAALVTHSMLLSDTMSLVDSGTYLVDVIRILNDKFNVSEDLAIRQAITLVVASALVVEDISTFADALTLDDTLGMAENLSDNILATSILLDPIAFTDTASNELLLLANLSDSLEVSESILSTMSAGELLTDGIDLSVVIVDGQEVLVGWVMNAKNLAVTEYSNFGFNSFAVVNEQNLAASEHGLYQLGGDLDAADQISARIRTGSIDIGNDSQTRIEKAYIGGTTEGKIVVKTITGDSIERWYKSVVPRTGSNTLRVTLGRGVKSRYWQFELVNEAGQDFNIEDVGLLPLNLTRR